MLGMPARLGLLATCATLVGALLFARGLAKLFRAVRARLTYGAPYRRGTIEDRLVALLLVTPIPVLGLALLGLALAQAAFQPVDETVRVGQIEVRRSGWGRTAIRFLPDPGYPGRRVLEAEVTGARWALFGTFTTWSRSLRWLGLSDGHRLSHLLAMPNTTGTTGEARTDRATLDVLPPAARLLVRLDPYLPFLTVRAQSSPWFPPAERRSLALYAIGPGYLAEDVEAAEALAPAGRGAAPY
ncbi:MAG: hypothetical protein ACE5JH_09805 [Acidobacteriota bacterium]